MQEKSKAKHKYAKSKPVGFYTSKDREYVYGDNTVRKSGRFVDVLFYVLPIVMVIILLFGGFLGYKMYVESAKGEENSVTANEEYVTPEQQKMLYKTVNIATPLERTFVPDTKEVKGVPVSVLMADSLEKLLDSADKSGVSLTVKRGYVSYDEQHELYTTCLDSLLDTGKYTQIRAESIANRKMGDSGNSERQLGLLVEFDCTNSNDFYKTPEFQWLNKFGAEYGFVQRYTKSNEQVTAMDNDYTLWRYIGKDNALLARKLGLDFDSLIDYLES